MAIENGVQNAELGYILDPAFQIENLNGKPVVGGYICIYEAGTDNKYISYENFDGAQNPFKIPLRADGRAVILGDPSLTYDIYFYDSYGNQLFSRLNVQCNVPGNISIKGADTRIKNTDGTLDISLQTMGNNVREYTVNTKNKLLDVQSPLYFVENSQSATIIGIKGGASGYVTKDYVDSVVSGKLDTSAFSAVSGDFLTDKFEYDDNFNITGYDGSAFASNGQTYSAGTNIDITDNVISVTGLPTSSDVENAISSAVTNVENKFEYNENNYITAYNNSAFAGTNYSAGDYVSIENDTISVTGLQPSGDYATKTELESATSGKQDTLSAGDGISIVNNVISVTAEGGIEQVSHDYTLSGDGNSTPLGIANIEDFVKQNDLTAYQEKGDYYSASNPSGFITEDAITGLQPSGDYATHDDLTAYATTALVSSVSSELYSAFSGISGDYELVAGSGVELVDDPNAKTTTINVTAEGTPVTAIEQMIESATSGKADTSAIPSLDGYATQDYVYAATSGKADTAHIIYYDGKPSANPIYAYSHEICCVDGIYGSGVEINTDNLYLSDTVTAHTGGFTANGVTATNNDSYFGINSRTEVFSGGGGGGFGFSSQNSALGTARLAVNYYTSQTVAIPSPKFEARNISGAGFSIEASAAKGYDHNGNVVWDTTKSPAPEQLVAGSDSPKPNILLSPYMPKSMSAQFSQAPLFSADGNGIYIGISGQYLKAQMNGTTARNSYFQAEVADGSGHVTGNSTMNGGEVSVYHSSAFGSAGSGTWSLTQSIQKREIEYDADTSAITAIAGSAIGGGGVSQSAFDELKQSYDALSALFATYSGQWLLPNEGEE